MKTDCSLSSPILKPWIFFSVAGERERERENKKKQKYRRTILSSLCASRPNFHWCSWGRPFMESGMAPNCFRLNIEASVHFSFLLARLPMRIIQQISVKVLLTTPGPVIWVQIRLVWPLCMYACMHRYMFVVIAWALYPYIWPQWIETSTWILFVFMKWTWTQNLIVHMKWTLLEVGGPRG